MKNAIAYCRVSTKKQGKTGYGLAAQRKNIAEFAKRNKYKILRYYAEIKSGKINKRPELLKALADAKKHDCALIVTKIDRLSRKLNYTTTLLETGLKLLVTEIPFASKFILHIMAAVAEQEAELISQRTLQGLDIASDKGIRFGTGANKSHAKQKKAYKAFAKKIRPKILHYRLIGFKSVLRLRDILNKNKVKTFRGGNAHWHLSTVHRLLKELRLLAR